MRLRAITATMLAGGALLVLPAVASAKGPPCPPGEPVTAHATFAEPARRSDLQQFVARVSVERGGEPLARQVPHIGLTRIGTEHPGGYLYFSRRPTGAAGQASVTVTVPSRGRWRYQLYACGGGEVEQSGPIPAQGLPDPPAPPSGDRPVAAGDEEAWGWWIAIAAALAATTAIALLLSARARPRA